MRGSNLTEESKDYTTDGKSANFRVSCQVPWSAWYGCGAYSHMQVDAKRFAAGIDQLNATLRKADNLYHGFLDNMLTSLTFQLWPVVFGTYHRRVRA